MEQKIIIIGYSGSGKSTMAQKLARQYSCEVLHLDCVHWLPNWQEREKEDEESIVSEFMDSHKSWVIEGNYKSVCWDRRMGEATQIIFLDFPAVICLYRAFRRYFTYRGKVRESITQGCEEKIDMEFLWWILHKGRNKMHKRKFRSLCKSYSDKAVVLKNPKAVREWEETLVCID